MPKGYPEKPYTVNGTPMTANAARLSNAGDNVRVRPAGSDVRTRNHRVIQMKLELNAMLDMISHSREQLAAELKNSYEDSKGIGLSYLKSLRELTAMFENMTNARIKLDKAEKQLEAEMSASDERRAAMEHIMSLDPKDRGQVIKDLIQQHNSLVATPGYTPRAQVSDVLEDEHEQRDSDPGSDS